MYHLSLLPLFELHWVGREGNKAIDLLAKFCKMESRAMECVAEVPISVTSVV